MYTSLPVLLTAGFLQVLPAEAQTPGQTDLRPVVVGLGAIGGVLGSSIAILGIGALPGGLAYSAGMTVPAVMSVAMGRLYATTGAVAGGLLGYYAASLLGAIEDRPLLIGLGAVASVLAFNVASAPLGAVPFAGAALEAVPVSIALGSRIVAATAAGAGALAANWLYDRWNGERSDQLYLATLVGGAIAGVAAGNLLVSGTLGSLPFAQAAAGATELASTAAQAASRLHAVGSAVIGGWAAHWLYGG